MKFEADIRDPYMGNTIPVTVWLRYWNGKISIEVETPEGGKRTGKLLDSKILSNISFNG